MTYTAASEPADGQFLAPCPCGNDGVWYRVAPPVVSLKPGKSVSNITGDDITENLCDACFVGFVPEASHDQWERAKPPERWANQTPRYDPCEVYDIAPFDVCDIAPDD